MPTVNILFGKEATQKILNNQQLSQEEILESQKSFAFETEEEADAFKKGIEAAVGWQEVYVLEGNFTALPATIQTTSN